LLRWLIWLVRCWCKWMLMCHGPWERQHSGYRVPAGPSFQPVPHRIPNESTNFDKPLMILASFTVWWLQWLHMQGQTIERHGRGAHFGTHFASRRPQALFEKLHGHSPNWSEALLHDTWDSAAAMK
jgi:hypothetical protein